MLTDLKARQAKVTGKSYAIADFDGLYLNISATGFKAWHFDICKEEKAQGRKVLACTV